MNSPTADQQRWAHRRFQFSLAVFVVLVAVCGAAAGLGARRLQHQRRARMVTLLAAPAGPLLQYVPYYEPSADIVSGEYGRHDLAMCVLRRTGHVRGDSPGICAVLAKELKTYRHLFLAAKTLHEEGVNGGADYDVSNAMFHIALVAAAIAMEQDDAKEARKKLLQCLELAKQHDDEEMRQLPTISKNNLRPLANQIRMAWLERIAARQRDDEAGYARALEAHALLLDETIACFQAGGDTQKPEPLVEAARLARAWLRARLANADRDSDAELMAWRDATKAAKALRSMAPDGPPPNDPGGMFSIHDAYWCGVTHPLLLSEPGLILAEPFHRSRDGAVRVAQQAAMAEYEALCGEAADRASGHIECPEFWDCLHSLARLDQIEAGY